MASKPEAEDLPDALKAAATDLRNALNAGKIERLYFWYVHIALSTRTSRTNSRRLN